MSATTTFRSRFTALAVAAGAAFALAGASPALAADEDPLLPPAGTCAHESDVTASRADQRAALRCLTDEVRANAGLDGLGEDNLLWNSAIDKAYDIRDCNAFDHHACGLPTDHYIEAEGYYEGCRAWGSGENIFYGQGELGSARNAMNAWLHSPGHRANLLDPDFRDQGVGLAQGSIEGRDDAQIWVHHFGYCD